MTWKLFELGYNFYFQKQCLDGVTRDLLHKTLDGLISTDNPLDYENVLTTCPIHKRIIVKIQESNKLLCAIIHWDDDLEIEYKHSIELVKIIDPVELLS